MTLYDKPLWQIIQDDLPSELGEPFAPSDAVEWILARYPKFKESSVRMHLRSMSANDRFRRHHPNTPKVLFRTTEGLLRRYDAEQDGLFDEHGRSLEAREDSLGQEADSADEEVAFALELHLEEFIDANWHHINFGRTLRRYDEQGRDGRQFATPVGIIDFLCLDEATGELVVIELKKGRSSDKVLGQCQRYMGWVQQHLAKPGQGVRGLIIAPEQDERLEYALKVTPSVDMLCYRVDFQLVKPAEATHD